MLEGVRRGGGGLDRNAGHVALPCEAVLAVDSMHSAPSPFDVPSVCRPRLRMPPQRAFAARCGTRTFLSPDTSTDRNERLGKAGRTDEAVDLTGAGPVATTSEGTGRERAGRLRYDPQSGGGPIGINRELAAPSTWRGIDDRSRKACAGVGIAVVSGCLRRTIASGALRGDDECGKPNGNNDLHVVD